MTTDAPRGLRDHGILPAVAVVVAYALVGLVAGFVWERIWTPPTQIVQQHQVFYADYASLRRVFTGTGLYVLVGGAASAAVALVVALLTRRRELLTLGMVVVGSSIAAVVMWKVGVSLGPADPAAVAGHAADGTHVHGNLVVNGHSPFLVWPMVSLFVVALVFFAWPGARRAGAHRDPPLPDHAEPEVSEPQRG